MAGRGRTGLKRPARPRRRRDRMRGAMSAIAALADADRVSDLCAFRRRSEVLAAIRMTRLIRFGSAPRRWQIIRMLEAGAVRLLLSEDREELCSGQNTSIVGKRASPVMQSQR